LLHLNVDGSGTHDGSSVVTLAGFVATESAWIDFNQKWNAVLDSKEWPTRLSEFHMVDCVHGDGEFFEGRWSYAQRLMLYGDLTRVIIQSDIRPIGSSVIVECFKQIPESDIELLRKDKLDTPLSVAFHMLVQQIIFAVHEADPSEIVGVLFDQDNKDREEIFSTLCDHYMSNFYLGDVFAGYGFASSKFTPLQAADLLAYGTLHLSQRIHTPSLAEPHFPVIRPFWNMLNRLAESPATSPNGHLCNLQTLTALVQKVKTKDMLPKKGGGY
jgi:hypothetical protein